MTETIEYSLSSQACHHSHQGKQNCKSAKIDIAEILGIWVDKESRDECQKGGNAENGFFLEDSLYNHVL